MRKHAIESDKALNSTLCEEVQELRGCMVDEARRNNIPERFTVLPHPNHPCVIISDKETGRSVQVPLFAYCEIRKVLAALF